MASVVDCIYSTWIHRTNTEASINQCVSDAQLEMTSTASHKRCFLRPAICVASKGKMPASYIRACSSAFHLHYSCGQSSFSPRQFRIFQFTVSGIFRWDTFPWRHWQSIASSSPRSYTEFGRPQVSRSLLQKCGRGFAVDIMIGDAETLRWLGVEFLEVQVYSYNQEEIAEWDLQ